MGTDFTDRLEMAIFATAVDILKGSGFALPEISLHLPGTM